MGANPMQKMKRNSTLLGLTIGLFIGLILCVLLYMFLTKSSGMSSTSKENSISVSVLNKQIKSGTKITLADIRTEVIDKALAPTDAVTLTPTSEAIAKIDLSAGTVIGNSMLTTPSEVLTADLREQEYNMIALPTQLSANDYIDIRLQLPNGGDYIVISKKQVLKCNSNTIWLNMYEEEIELLGNAIIEYYIMAGSKLYATKYVEPGSQAAAVGTYVPNEAVSDLIKHNPNIQKLINTERYSEALVNIRNSKVKSILEQYGESRLENIEKNIQEEIKTLQQSREAYFGALNSAQ